MNGSTTRGTTPAGEMRLAWLALLLSAALVFGPALFNLLRPSNLVRDFFQDYASVKFFHQGKSIYFPLLGAYEQQFKVDVDWERWHYGRTNPHPPASLVPVFPFAVIDYPWAGFAFNIANLACIVWAILILVRELKFDLNWKSGSAGLALLLAFSPLYAQILHAQNNGIILLLLVATWAALRHGADVGAGLCLGLAAGIKLIPALLFLYLLFTRRWAAFVTGVVVFLAFQAGAWALFGSADFLVWLENLRPHTDRFRAGWLNQSLFGFFARLFEESGNQPGATPLLVSPLVSQILAYSASLLLIGLAALPALWVRVPAQADVLFGLWVTTMLLVSPLTWDHYLLFAIVPLMVTWRTLPTGLIWAACYGWVVLLLWMHPSHFWNQAIPGGFSGGTALPWQSLTVVSYKFHGLLVLWGIQFGLMVYLRRATESRTDPVGRFLATR